MNEYLIEDSQFIECKSDSTISGGGSIYVNSVNNLAITKCSFILCSAINGFDDCGGAVFITGHCKSITIDENCFSRCSSSRFGNAFYISISNGLISSSDISINSCPHFLKSGQSASVYLKGQSITKNFNISKCHALYSPAFIYKSPCDSVHQFYTIRNQTGSVKFVMFEFESNGNEKTSVFKKWNLIFEEPKNIMVFNVDKHLLERVIFFGGESDYTLEVNNGSLLYESVRADRKLKVGKKDDKSLKVISEFTFDRDEIKLNENKRVKDNQCQLVFRHSDDVHISFKYIIYPFVVIALSAGTVFIINAVVNCINEPKGDRDDEVTLKNHEETFLEK